MMQNIYTAVILIITSFLTLSAGEMQTGPYKNAGYRGGAKIPTGGRIIDLEKEYGVIPDDNQDDSKAIQEAINDQKGKFDETGEHAILLLPRGVINIHGADSGGHLEEGQIFLHVKGVVLRGRGNNPHTGTVVIYKHSKPVYDVKSYEPDIEGKIWPGIAAFRIETRRFFDSSSPIPGSINFRWKAGKNVHMQGGGKKGDEQIKLLPSALEEFDVGDTIWVGAVNTEEFLAEYNVPKYYRRCANPCVRVDVFEVEDIDRAGGTLTINDPLPFDLPYSEGSKVYPKERYSKVMKPFFIEEVGIEDLYFIHSLEGTPYTHLNTNIYNDASNPNGIRFNYGNQAPEYAVHAVLLKFAKNCWVKGVHIAVSGSHPIVTETVYRCTIKDNIMQNSYNKGKGGHGYFRGSKAHECLFENNYQDGVRHFTFQWSADQNVSRYNQNIGAGDLNMHGGFERFNWLEHNYAELSFFHRSWKDPVIGPGTQTWYPIWWGSTLHCSKWAGVSTGPDNVFYNCVLKKQADAYAPMENWGISDTPGVEYHWGWDGEKFRHPRIKNTLMSTHGSWVNTDFSEFPNSGVYKKGKPYKDEKPPQLSIDKVDRENKNYFNLTGKAKDDVACKVEISLNRQHFATAFGMVRWQYPVNVKKMPDGINYLLVRAVDGAGNCTYRALNINKKSDTDNTVRKIAFYPEKIDYSFQSKGKKFINIIRVKLKNTFSRNMSFKTVKAASPAGLGASIVSGSGSLTPQQSREITVKISSSSSEFNKKHYQIFNIISGNKKEELRLQYYPPVPSGGKHPCFVYKPQTFDKLKQDNLRRQWGENAFKQLQKTYNDHREKVLPEKKGKYIAVGKKPRLSAVVPDYYLKKHFKTARSVYYSALLYAFSGKKEYLEEVKKIFRHYGKLYPSLPYTDSHG
ncbi:MAG TPA: hypothetical protein VKS21_10115, partial [Spirochaetota bacterium]|nr:hypothetical protein [Spirochaetota bacterium]